MLVLEMLLDFFSTSCLEKHNGIVTPAITFTSFLLLNSGLVDVLLVFLLCGGRATFGKLIQFSLILNLLLASSLLFLEVRLVADREETWPDACGSSSSDS